MQGRFYDAATEDIYNGVCSVRALRLLPLKLHDRAHRKLLSVLAAVRINDLRVPPGNRLEALRGKREGEYSIRINDQYRICFRWTDIGAMRIEIADYH